MQPAQFKRKSLCHIIETFIPSVSLSDKVLALADHNARNSSVRAEILSDLPTERRQKIASVRRRVVFGIARVAVELILPGKLLFILLAPSDQP